VKPKTCMAEVEVGRVLFEMTPVPATMTRRNGHDIQGEATCSVDLIEPAENAFGADFPESVRNLRGRVDEDGSLRSRPPEQTDGYGRRGSGSARHA
jgi:hypothetical protein